MASHFASLRDYVRKDFDWSGHETLPDATLALAANYQAPNGGMVYYIPEDDYASPYLSAYTALAFHWLRERGHTIPSAVETRLHDYLNQFLRTDVFPEFYTRGMSSSVRAVALAALGSRRLARDRRPRALPLPRERDGPLRQGPLPHGGECPRRRCPRGGRLDPRPFEPERRQDRLHRKRRRRLRPDPLQSRANPVRRPERAHPEVDAARRRPSFRAHPHHHPVPGQARSVGEHAGERLLHERPHRLQPPLRERDPELHFAHVLRRGRSRGGDVRRPAGPSRRSPAPASSDGPGQIGTASPLEARSGAPVLRRPAVLLPEGAEDGSGQRRCRDSTGVQRPESGGFGPCSRTPCGSRAESW